MVDIGLAGPGWRDICGSVHAANGIHCVHTHDARLPPPPLRAQPLMNPAALMLPITLRALASTAPQSSAAMAAGGKAVAAAAEVVHRGEAADTMVVRRVEGPAGQMEGG